MATFTYTAKRGIKSGHTSGLDYTITIDLLQYDPKLNPQGSVNTSLAGVVEHVLHRINEDYSIATDYILADGPGTPDTDDFNEFFRSCAASEEFTFNDGSDVQMILTGASSQRRNAQYFNYSFNMRVAV